MKLNSRYKGIDTSHSQHQQHENRIAGMIRAGQEMALIRETFNKYDHGGHEHPVMLGLWNILPYFAGAISMLIGA